MPIIVTIFYRLDIKPVKQNSVDFNISLAKLAEAALDDFDSGFAGCDDEYGGVGEMSDNCGISHIQGWRGVDENVIIILRQFLKQLLELVSHQQFCRIRRNWAAADKVDSLILHVPVNDILGKRGSDNNGNQSFSLNYS